MAYYNLPSENLIIPEVRKSDTKRNKIIMGDKSPKAVHKKSNQKQNAANIVAKSKHDAIAAKQAAGQKK